jgi:MFS transporter, DHA1 family, multidrug resistance protein
VIAAKTARRSALSSVGVPVAGVPVVVDYLLSHLGFFSVLPVLPLLLTRLAPGTSPLFVGASLFAFNFAVRGASLFCSGLLHRSPVRRAMVGGLLVAALGFAAVPLVSGQVGILICLLVSGTGISINGLMARVYIALSLESTAARNTVFSAMQVVVNVAAALGPIVANLLVGRRLDLPLLFGVSTMYVFAALAVGLMLPGGLRPGDHDVRPPLRLGLLRALVTDPDIRRVSAVTAVGTFLYAQFFSAIALQVVQLTESAALRASFFTANGILVVVVQVPMTTYVTRRLVAGVAPVGFLVAGILTFAAAFMVMGITGTTVIGAFATVVVFSVAETLFTPMVNTAFSNIQGGRPTVELFNLRQVAVTAGESLGSFVGGALFLTALAYHVGSLYWVLPAAVGAVAALSYLMTRNKSDR